MSASGRVLGDRDHYLGIALLIVGAIALGVKLMPKLLAVALKLFWPLVLIFLGWRIYRKAVADSAAASEVEP